MQLIRILPLFSAFFLLLGNGLGAEWLHLPGGAGPGQGKHIVLISGDEEYRSEEALPMLARILSSRHGFECTVLFAIDPATGTIEPTVVTNIPGLEALERADLCILGLRFRELPDRQMRYFDKYIHSGKPLIGLRTSTHAFAYERNRQSPYARYDWRSRDWEGGFGRQVLGETWIDHHGSHGRESTRGIIAPEWKAHPVLKGVEGIWGPTDVYKVIHLETNAQVLVRGEVLAGMKPTDPPVAGPKNDPLMPLVWVRSFTGEPGRTAQVLATTMGAAVDFESEGLRRLIVNACYWLTGLEGAIPARADVRYVGEYQPTWFGFGKHRAGVKPADLETAK